MSEAGYFYEQLSLFDDYECPRGGDTQDSSSGRTYPEHSQAIKGLTFEPCLRKSDRPLFQCLMVGSGRTQGWLNCLSAKLHGVSLTLNTTYHSDVSVSFLSQILQPSEDVPEKYFLSSRACLGILRRAEKRGKELPPELKAALEAQASCECVPDVPGGGKGALVSKEKSLSLLNHNEQVLFTGNCLTPWDCQAKRIYKQDGVFPCLQSTESNGEKPGSVYVPDKARSLTARNDGSPCVDRGPDIVAAGFKAGAGADAGGLGYQVEQMPTLTSAESGTQRPTVAVYDMQHADEVMRPVDGGKCQTLNARMGTGGNQVPVLAYTQQAFGQYEETGKASAIKARDYKDATDLCVQKSVRRLTPTECERLQGLPDGYTEGGSDTQRYKALGNGMCQPVADYIIRRIKEVAT